MGELFLSDSEEDKEEVREPNECRNLSTDQERALDDQKIEKK